jgi:heat shock protein HslJ
MRRQILLAMSICVLSACQEIDILTKKFRDYNSPENIEQQLQSDQTISTSDSAKSKSPDQDEVSNQHGIEVQTDAADPVENLEQTTEAEAAHPMNHTSDYSESNPIPTENNLTRAESLESDIISAQSISDEAPTSPNTLQLYGQRWQIIHAELIKTFNFDPDHWIFQFDENGNYKAFGTCNHVYGKYSINSEQSFRIRKLATTNQSCPMGRTEEPLIFNTLILANGFLIENNQLMLLNDEKSLITFQATLKQVKFSLKPNKPKSTPQKYKAKPRKRLIKNKVAKE